MTPKERFERTVTREGFSERLWRDEVVALLLLEHRRVVRLVTRLQTGKGQTEAALCQPAYQLACTDVKKALDGEP